MTEADTFKLASQFDALPDDAIVTTKTAAVILGGALTERENPAVEKSADQAAASFPAAVWIPSWRSARTNSWRDSTRCRLKYRKPRAGRGSAGDQMQQSDSRS